MSEIGVASHTFGGDWTSKKLDILERYLQSYTTALKNQRFVTEYIDAFAGTGYREPPSKAATSERETLLFPELAANEPQQLLEGSARKALRVEPPFDRYIFIERNRERCAQLERLEVEFESLGHTIEICQGDANEEIRRLCNRDWRNRRAVLFLDPYGMQVEWATLEAVARTGTIDLWILFPLGIGVNRLLTKSGDIPNAWRRRLDLLLGTSDWYEEFYKFEPQPTLFGDEINRVVKASTEVIGKYFNRRLESIFAGVAPQPKVLRNSTNNPLYLLCFAASNHAGKKLALRIARHILENM